MTQRDAVFFISFGGPDKQDDVIPFLENVTRGRGIPRERLAGVAEHYAHFGGKSPINEITRRQADALEAKLKSAGDGRRVYVGQRNWHPFIEDVLRQMKEDGIATAVGFCTAAYRCEASLERYVQAVEKAREAIGPGAPVIRYVDAWFSHPLFVSAMAARAREAAPPAGTPWVFTAHSIPCAMAKDSNYVEELKALAEAVAKACGIKDWRLAFTSRSGSPRDAWLEPDVSKIIRADAAKGVKEIFLLPIGFLADHVEVLYDLDVEAKAAADAVGVTLRRCQTVGDHPDFIAMIADVIARDGGEAAASSKRRGEAPPDCYCFPGDPAAPCRRPAVGRP
jgi:ferrochelatase